MRLFVCYMSSDGTIAEIVNSIGELTLEQEVTFLKKIMQRSATPSFIMGYCAAKTSTFERVARYIQEQVGSQSQPIELTLEPMHGNLIFDFLHHKGEMQSSAGDVVFVKVSGFEKLSALNPESGIADRIAHDYDQDVCEGKKGRFDDIHKKIIVITHINPSGGEEAYEAAVRSACGSQFRSFLYEFK